MITPAPPRSADQVFISYAHAPADERAADFAADLANAAGLYPWIDRLRLRATTGEALNTEIAEAIRGSRAVMLVASSVSYASPYVRSEVSHALVCGVPVIRLEIEPVEPPDELLPVRSCRRVRLHQLGRDNWPSALIDSLATTGLKVRTPTAIDPLLTADARVLRPSYRMLKKADEARWREYVERLTAARALNPANGYNALSLAMLRLFLKDAPRAIEAAEVAVRDLPREPDAYFAFGLARAAAQPLRTAFHADIEAILQDLARARRLERPRAHVDCLSAIIVAEHYLPNRLSAPIEPMRLVEMASAEDRWRDAEEIERVLDTLVVTSSELRAAIQRLVT
jgi:hypothetical protein